MTTRSEDRNDPGDVQLGLTWRQRDRLARLQRRRDYLADLIDDGLDNPFDVAEMSALDWAMRVIRAAAKAGLEVK